jgi:two-component system nitrate/nitrite response regulator NarL
LDDGPAWSSQDGGDEQMFDAKEQAPRAGGSYKEAETAAQRRLQLGNPGSIQMATSSHSIHRVVSVMRNPLISVVVADDHPVVLRGLVSLLRSCPDFNVVAECRDGRAAVKAIEQFAPSIAVLDMVMPGLNGLEVFLAIAAFGSKTRIVFLTALATANQILTAMGRGAKGILHKDVAADELTKCIRAVAQGQEWLSESMAELIARVSKQVPPSANGNSLSMREKEVMNLASSGLSNKEIVRRLSLSEGTVKTHLHNIYQRLGVPNRTTLTALAIAHRRDPA